jgi:glycosyltransferase involved in cell wall biosynthesis
MKRFKIIALMNSCAGGIGGGDVRFVEIANRLVRKNVEIWVVTSKLGEKICEKRRLNAKYVLTTTEERVKNIIFTYLRRIIKALLLRLELKEGGILYSTSDFLPDVLPAFVLKLRNGNVKWVQVVHHLYENPVRRRGKNFLVNLLGFLSQRIGFIMVKWKADLVIAVNPLVKWQLVMLGFNAQKIGVNYNGVDLMKMKSIKPSDRKYDCVFLGRLNVSKGIFDLIKIWKVIVNKNPNVILAVIGGGDKSLEYALRHRVEENKLENNIDVLGFLYDEQAFEVLKSCKVFVFPSYEEGFGIAALEAMVCGLPVVAWDLPVYHEVFPKGMVKVPIGDVERFADEVLRLLNDSELYSKMSNDAIETASKYDWDKIAEEELELLKGVYSVV